MSLPARVASKKGKVLGTKRLIRTRTTKGKTQKAIAHSVSTARDKALVFKTPGRVRAFSPSVKATAAEIVEDRADGRAAQRALADPRRVPLAAVLGRVAARRRAS